jgi:hexosaminidase
VARPRLAGALGLALGLAATAALAQPPSVVPAPASFAPSAGPTLSLADGMPIAAPSGDAGALKTARYLAAILHRTRGLNLPVIAGSAPAGRPAIVLSRTGPSGEAYRLRAEVSGATIGAADDAGLFYGAVTLWQLAGPGRGPAQIPSGEIDDAPRFAWRGLMIDSARHFQPPAEIEKIIDAMAALKLNTLHWHLTDDQGWRLEIKKYPKLTSVGAWRTPEKGSPDGAKRYGGFYTQAQVREVVAYAAARHITIVPEIEMPGHATSALIAYPQFGSGAAPAAADQALWGITPYVYGVDDRSLGFLQDVLTEVMALFPGRYIHVGGDEAERERWNASPAAQARMKALGSEDPAALQAWFTQRIAKFLEAHGRRLVGWDEILGGGELPGDAVVTSWHGIDGGLAAAAKGHDAVMAPAPIYYFDNRQGLGADEPPGRGWLVRLPDVYAFEPIPPAMSADAARHILGVQGNLWTEHVRTSADLEAMAFPRAAAIAETGWTPAARKAWPDFFRRLPAELARERALGLRPDAAAVSVLATVAPATKVGPDMVTLSAQGGGEIRYTTDGAEPGAASAVYASPLPATRPIRAALILDGVRIGPTASWTPAALRIRRSQELKLCNDKLGLNLEGAAGPVRRTFLINPGDPCWSWAGADLTGVGQVTVAFERLPFNLAMDPAHNTAMVHPPRRPAGELEVRQDSCLSDPIAVAAVPPGAPGTRSVLSLKLPPRTGRHDLCFSFTGMSFDPVKALERVELGPAP